jgi:hypothetical protein
MQASDTDEGGTSDDRDGADNDDAIARIEAELERSRAGTLDDRQETVESAWDATGRSSLSDGDETVESAWDATGRSSLSDGGDAMRLIEAELGAESETRVEGKSELGVGKQEDWPFTDSDEESTFDKSEKAEPEPEPKSEPEPKPEPEPEPEPELAPEQKQPDVDPRIAGVQFVKEQQEHALRLATLRARTPSQSGNVQCQYGGKKKFVPVFLQLDKDGVLSMRTANKGRDGKVLRTGSVLGCSVGELKNERKGHSLAFRVDIEEKDSKGDHKYVFSVDTAEEKELWMRRLSKWGELNPGRLQELVKEIEEVDAEAAAAAAAMPAPEEAAPDDNGTSVIVT